MAALYEKKGKKARSALCLLVILSMVIMSLSFGGPSALAADGVEFDLGANPGSVTGVLSPDGVLRVSGVGETADYTPETAPFAGLNVTSLEIGSGVSSLGAYLFYGCGGLTGELSLPDGLLSIGDGAFSGSSLETAAHFTMIRNGFTQRMATEKKDGEEADSSQYEIKTLTQQELGQEVFYPGSGNGGCFLCGEANGSFREAAKQAGYQEAVNATLSCGNGQGSPVSRLLPVTEGCVILPPLPEGFTGPEGGGLRTYVFSGWMESEDSGTAVREPGSAFPVAAGKAPIFEACWVEGSTVKLGSKVESGVMTLTVPEIEGYDITSYRWQVCELSGKGLPADESLLDWKAIENETGNTYRRKLAAGDGDRAFRCVLTLKKQALFALFNTEGEEELALDAVQGPKAYSAEVQVATSPGSYEGVTFSGETAAVVAGPDGLAVVPECGYTASGEPAVVFCGWKDGSGNHYDPGDLIPGGTVLTAKWETPLAVYYVNKGASSGGETADGLTPETACSMERAFTLLAGETSSPETAYRNILVLAGSFTAPDSWGTVPFTLTDRAPGSAASGGHTLTLGSGGATLQSGVRLDGITVAGGAQPRICANGYSLTIGGGISISGVAVYGGNEAAPVSGGSADIRLFSGSYPAVYGGGNAQPYAGSSRVLLDGASVTGSVYGAGGSAGFEGNTEVMIASGTVGGSVYGGSGGGAVTGNTAAKLRGGTVSGSLCGGGVGTVSGTRAVSICGGAVSGAVYGGSPQVESRTGSKIVVKAYSGSLSSLRQAGEADIISSTLTLSGGKAGSDAQSLSLAQIDDLRLAGSQLRLNAGAEGLGAMGNYTASGESLAVSSDAASRSTLCLDPGVKLQVKNASGVYGTVSGVLYLDLAPGGGARGAAVWAKGDSASGSFVKAGSETASGLEMVSGKAEAGYYSWQLGGDPDADEGDISRKAYGSAGRVFTEISGTEPASVVGNGAVTAYFVTSYLPNGDSARKSSLSLCRVSDGVEVAFPAGSRIVLADISDPAACRYYKAAPSGQSGLPLSAFSSLDGGAAYAEPAAGTEKITEKLLFALDFSGASVPLEPGDYELRLAHFQGETARQVMRFAAASAENTLRTASSVADGKLLNLTLTPTVSSMDTRYGAGAVIKLFLTNESGEAIGFPGKTSFFSGAQALDGSDGFLRSGDGSVSLYAKANEALTVTIDFTQVSEDMIVPGVNYGVKAELRPRPGLHTATDGGAADAADNTTRFSVGEAQPERAIGVALAAGGSSSDRILDVSEGDGVLDLTVNAQTVEGDSLCAVLYKKGNAADMNSYAVVEGADWCALGELSSGAGTAVLTVPKGTASGTYRVLFCVKDTENAIVASAPYNFIVK